MTEYNCAFLFNDYAIFNGLIPVCILFYPLGPWGLNLSFVLILCIYFLKSIFNYICKKYITAAANSIGSILYNALVWIKQFICQLVCVVKPVSLYINIVIQKGFKVPTQSNGNHPISHHQTVTPKVDQDAQRVTYYLTKLRIAQCLTAQHTETLTTLEFFAIFFNNICADTIT